MAWIHAAWSARIILPSGTSPSSSAAPSQPVFELKTHMYASKHRQWRGSMQPGVRASFFPVAHHQLTVLHHHNLYLNSKHTCMHQNTGNGVDPCSLECAHHSSQWHITN